ncbi:uncharacterized protein LOC124894333, partial [Capsicum annuum]|uniref:uncharacterized protein LOC124894333 n=1 Tax=Capsicum annuum TaxID=4072 RepID=UPI001FB18894
MPDTGSKNTGERVDVAAGEGTSKSPPIQVNQSEAQVERVFEMSSTPDRIRARRTTFTEPLVNAADQDMRDAVQLLTRIVAGQVQGQAIPTAGPSGTDRVASLRTQDFLKMDLPTFTGSDLNKDLQNFIDQIQRAVELGSKHLHRKWKIRGKEKEHRNLKVDLLRRPDLQGSSAPPQHQGFRGSQFGERSEGHSSRSVGYHGQGNMSQLRPSRELCNRCGKHHMGVCRMGTNVCFWCGMTGHIMRECPRRGAGGVARPSGSAIASSSS